MESITLKVLSPVTSSEEVFGHVITVEDPEGKVFTLGCAHCCKWTLEQLTTADKLEGCYTPATYKDNKRLLMGYHPQAVTQWEYNKTPQGVFITLTVPEVFIMNANAEQLEIDFPYALNVYGDDQQPNLRVLRSLWNHARQGREPSDAVRAYYRSVGALCQTRRLATELAQLAWRLVVQPSLPLNWVRNTNVTFDSTQRPRFCESYYKRLIVVATEPEEGFAEAYDIGSNKDFPRFYNTDPDKDWVARSSSFDYDVDIMGDDYFDYFEEWVYTPQGHNYHRITVVNSNPEEGCAKAISIELGTTPEPQAAPTIYM